MKPQHLAILLLLLTACGDADGGDGEAADRTECAKVLCEADEYCLQVTGGARPDSGEPYGQDPPTCTQAPEDCEGVPSCDCLPDCSDCTDDDGVYCHIAAP